MDRENIIRLPEKWLPKWQEDRLFEADPDPSKPKYFVTFPYPYLSGPLHLGHAFSSSRADAVARFKRHLGYNVLFPFAFHATGEPIVGLSERLKKGDKKAYEIFKNDGLDDETIESFKDPMNIVNHYRAMDIDLANRLGLSIDWRRQFVTIDPQYNRFVEWQYWTLREKEYITKGTHPVIWCPHCKSPTGDHDRLVGEGVSPTEFILLKFKFKDGYLVPGTLRPETIFGVTNMWINPDAKYVKAKVDDEIWYISEATVKKLENQLHKVEILEKFDGKDIIGEYSTNPVNGNKIINLPAKFVDPEGVTGVVMSVPAHAPYDWLALRDLQNNPDELKKYGIDPEEVKSIKPISLIKIDGFGEYPAVEIVDQMGVKDQNDPKAKEATKVIYKKEFHTGVLKDITGEYSGIKISEIKERITQDFVNRGIATKMWEPEDLVVCRCGTRCIVKVLEDQWFLKYSDEGWKSRAREALAKCKLYPEDYRTQFENVIDWLHDKACTRKSGMGTRLPWDPDWLVETLSDSTIYMAFYTISKYIYGHKIPPEQLTREFFDYVFLGKGSVDEVSEKTGIDKNTLESMRNEFEYWYGVDFRNSGKDLVNNHLTFYLFHHVAIWDDEKYWPHGIGVNGFVTSEGEKMSKSKGNFVRLEDVLREFGPDIVRMNLLYSAEGTQDPGWKRSGAESLFGWFSKLLSLVDEVKEASAGEPETIVDRWLLSRASKLVSEARQHYEKVMLRSAIKTAFFDMMNDISWYKRRGGNNKGVLRKVIEAMLVMIEPVAPFISQEAWSRLGHKEYIAFAEWPNIDFSDELAERAEDYVRAIYSDVSQLVSLMHEKPSKLYLYIASDWKRKAINLVKDKKPKEFVKALMSDPEIKERGKEAVSLAQALMKKYAEVRDPFDIDTERKILEESRSWLENEFGVEVIVDSEDSPSYDPAGKAKRALPMRPAIYLE